MLLDYSADQAKQRRWVRLEDQFGRWWGTYVEKSTGDPCCEISPFGGWNDPLNTPNVYLRVPHHEDGTTVSGKVEVAFDRWIDSITGSESDWLKTIKEAGAVTYKKTTPEERRLWPEDPELQEIAGPRPFPTLDMLKKARNGDKKLLGLDFVAKTGAMNAGHMTYLEFVNENRKDDTGRTRPMAEIGKLWKEHRTFVEEQEEIAELGELPKLEKIEA